MCVINLVYKIPYCRARAWPSGCSAFGPSARASKGILHTIIDHSQQKNRNMSLFENKRKSLFSPSYELYTRYPIVARRAWPAFRPSALREQRYLAYKAMSCARYVI